MIKKILSFGLMGLMFSTTSVFAQQQQRPPTNNDQLGTYDNSEDIIKDSYDRALMELLPVNPEQMIEMRKRYEDTKRSIEEPIGPPPKISNRLLKLTLEPNESTPQLNLYVNNLTTLVFSDITGQPWIIQSAASANTNFVVNKIGGLDENSNSNMVTVFPSSQYARGNLVVTLKDNPVPITFSLISGQDKVDFRTDVRIQKRGPHAVIDANVTSRYLKPTDDSLLTEFLYGIAPDKAIKYKTNDKNVEAWQFEDKLFIRTEYNLVSPGPIAVSSDVSGIHAYSVELNTKSPTSIILVKDPSNGRKFIVEMER